MKIDSSIDKFFDEINARSKKKIFCYGSKLILYSIAFSVRYSFRTRPFQIIHPTLYTQRDVTIIWYFWTVKLLHSMKKYYFYLVDVINVFYFIDVIKIQPFSLSVGIALGILVGSVLTFFVMCLCNSK